MDKYLNLQHNNQLNPSEKEEDASQIIERLKKKHKENQEFKELFQEAKLESLGVNLTFYDKFYCPDTIRSIKTLPQLYSLTRNLNKNLSKETHIDDVAKYILFNFKSYFHG